MRFTVLLLVVLACTSPEPRLHSKPEVQYSRIEELLIGRYPGVEVRRTNGGYLVTIRGIGSFSGNNQPLWVIDDVPFEVRTGRDLAWLSPQDVERIQVLKSAAETSLYGMRGGNGVILVTTKRTHAR